MVILSHLSAHNAYKAKQPPPPMNFFLTSVGVGKGADLGGLKPEPTPIASGWLRRLEPVTRLGTPI